MYIYAMCVRVPPEEVWNPLELDYNLGTVAELARCLPSMLEASGFLLPKLGVSTHPYNSSS